MSYTPTHARRETGRGRRLLGVAALTASFLVPVGLQSVQAADPPCPTSPDKCYRLVIEMSQATPGLGNEATFKVVITNLSRKGSGVSIGSGNLAFSPPSGLSDFVPAPPSPVAATPAGTATLNTTTSTWELRNLSIAPGRSGGFTFKAKVWEPTINWASRFKQANNFSGSGNDFYLFGSEPRSEVVSSCEGQDFDSCGEGTIDPQSGGSVATEDFTSEGGESATGLRVNYVAKPSAPAGARFAVRLLSHRNTPECPIILNGIPQNCLVSGTVDYKHPSLYSPGDITLDIRCDDCAGKTMLWFRYDEVREIQEPLVACIPGVSELIVSPLTGSRTCIDGMTVRLLGPADDWKVMGVGV